MIVLHVQVVRGPMVSDRTDGISDVFVQIPEAVCSSFVAALRHWPVGREASFQWGGVAIVGYVRAVHEQLAMALPV